MESLSTGWARGFAWVYLILAVAWFALAINWLGDDAWGHGLLTLAAGAGCLWAHERFERKDDG